MHFIYLSEHTGVQERPVIYAYSEGGANKRQRRLIEFEYAHVSRLSRVKLLGTVADQP